MNHSPLVSAVDRLTSGNYSPGDVQVISDIFTRYLSDESSSLNTLLNGQCHRGMRVAIRELRWRRHIAGAVSLIDHQGATTHSLAVSISRELSRLQRTHRPATDPLGQALQAALQSHPAGGASVSSLWPIIDQARQE